MRKDYEQLAIAIVQEAVKDYRRALRHYKRANNAFGRDAAKYEIHELEKFFNSEFFGLLADVDPEYIMERVREEIGV